MNIIGIIDIGANSVRLMLSEIHNNGFYRVIDELNTPIRLCEDLIHSDLISEDKISLTLNTLKSYKTLCNVSGAEKIHVVANDTLQAARNKHEIFDRITKNLGLEISFLTPSEDMDLTFLGVKSGIYLKSGLIVDIEGSSTHIIEYVDGEMVNQAYLPIGSVNISYMFSLNDRIKPEPLEEAQYYINNLLSDHDWILNTSHNTIIGVGGTFRALGKINRISKRYLLDISHNYKMEDRDFYDCYNMLKTKDFKQRKKVEGLSPNRADIIFGGSLIIKCIMKQINDGTIFISNRGLRDGIIENVISNHCNFKDILDYSLESLMYSLNLNKPHCEQLYWLTNTLFHKLKPLHRLSDEYDNIIKTASILHDCGISIDYANHHKHSFYIILHSRLNGLTHKELISSAAIAATHRNNSYVLPFPQFSYLINRLDFDYIEKIGVLLRIAEGLDRTLVGAVTEIDVEISEDDVTLVLGSKCCIHLEISQAMRASKKFFDIYGKNLKIFSKKDLN